MKNKNNVFLLAQYTVTNNGSYGIVIAEGEDEYLTDILYRDRIRTPGPSDVKITIENEMLPQLIVALQRRLEDVMKEAQKEAKKPDDNPALLLENLLKT
jgi:hypothetical protein